MRIPTAATLLTLLPSAVIAVQPTPNLSYQDTLALIKSEVSERLRSRASSNGSCLTFNDDELTALADSVYGIAACGADPSGKVCMAYTVPMWRGDEPMRDSLGLDSKIGEESKEEGEVKGGFDTQPLHPILPLKARRMRRKELDIEEEGKRIRMGQHMPRPPAVQGGFDTQPLHPILPAKSTTHLPVLGDGEVATRPGYRMGPVAVRRRRHGPFRACLANPELEGCRDMLRLFEEEMEEEVVEEAV